MSLKRNISITGEPVPVGVASTSASAPVTPVPPRRMQHHHIHTQAQGTSNTNTSNSTSTSSAETPSMASLEEVLEKQWEMGAHFFMEQAQHFDIASLLSCLHKLKRENLELEDKLEYMQTRRNNLLAVNARLVAPLGGYQIKNDYRPPSSSADIPEQQPPRRPHRS